MTPGVDLRRDPNEPEERNASRPFIARRRREWFAQSCWAAGDALIVLAATYTAAWLRYDLDLNSIVFLATTRFAAYAALIYLVLGLVAGPYRVGHLRGSFEETADIGRACLLTAVVLVLLALLTPWFDKVPRSLALLTPVMAMVGMFTLRFVVRSYRFGRTTTAGDTQKVIVFGAGFGGRQLIRGLRRDEGSPYVPVALLDDDPRKRRLKIDGLRVSGGLKNLSSVAAKTGATTLVIAIPSAETELVRDVRERAAAVDLQVLIVPTMAQLLGASFDSTDLREINLEDLLGRRKVELDDAAIARSLRDKVVLVTGAGGSIGSELARQIYRYEPKKLVLLDRDESALHGVQMSLTGRALLDDGTLALTDIRDLDALRAIFVKEQPELVFHAAALKHLTLLERFPLEGWKTNVLGTLNVLQAASEFGVETFVNVSTDKAADPSCVLGYTKRLAERLTAEYSTRGTGRYVSVRFGNVLGSRGSVITAFTAQIDRGGPITVTHPDVERYFMLIPEASQLVLQASAIGTDGEVMVLEMGEPVKIVDVAHTLIDLSGRRDIDIVFTGLRHGEKLSEVLFYPGDEIRPSTHPMVNCVEVPAISAERVLTVDTADAADTYRWMRDEAMTKSPMRGQA
ncbi:polysaccharide biosynthesis protein [Leekyejoonella antrihumi]|uniref:Polysaccharide biosynthesis protein n=1 Tax=Leekyejoonella antrihumi TaxID=1660198 RepID=A0A563E031_9MICO|nr:nucleoside-diphosphate sugar epimerase/dehydratase [Leekyejoonella antrihumi]TWP35898.1 polysaccharide biosynthesis protein [Leekyejoonella antrihumi]